MVSAFLIALFECGISTSNSLAINVLLVQMQAKFKAFNLSNSPIIYIPRVRYKCCLSDISESVQITL